MGNNVKVLVVVNFTIQSTQIHNMPRETYECLRQEFLVGKVNADWDEIFLSNKQLGLDSETKWHEIGLEWFSHEYVEIRLISPGGEIEKDENI